MDISVIIVNYHCAPMTIDCIRSVFEKTQGVACEVIVVDNASGDGSVELLRETFGEQIKVIASDTNLGFGKANNLGAQHASGKYLFLLNPDTILINDAISILSDYLKKHPDAGVAGGNLYARDMSPASSFCRSFDDLKSERRRASWLYLIGSKAETKLRQKLRIPMPMKEFNFTDREETVAYIFGADMMMPRRVFEEVGGFDPDFFMYAEEEELTWRITQKGYRVVSVPQAKIIHLEGGTTCREHTFSERQFRMRMSGTMTYFKKRFGEAGMHEFFRLRTRRYERLMKIAQVQGKLTENSGPAVTKRLLAEEYQAILKK